MTPTLAHMDVVVDALIAQGQGNLAVRLVAAEGQPALPSFEAGAHIDLHLPGALVRQYSIASAPEQRSHYLLCVRREAASRGGSAYVHERLRVGERLRIGTPRNLFRLHTARHSILLAGGIGITPLLSMAQGLDAAGQSFELHYYVRHRRDAAFARQLQKGFRHGTVHLHCSAEGDSARHGLPQSLHTPDVASHIYTCGSHGFMAHVQETAQRQGWPAAQLHQEAFAPAPASEPAGGAQQEQAFEVELGSSGQVYTIPVGRSIAAVLLDAGVPVPLSCEMGICGACLTPVTAGQPDHRDSVQSEAEKAAAVPCMALCCSRSHSPRLVLGL
ncbi:vanillate O-demethylase ferredoxin subunit [Lampropedia hyalina DSM 16112]|uniref:Vanillate O-demethylase ferredoxin subunit n=1 Tax=Lampropedia hyalina DSM 16112 TaxID=1122156 RepID=A0A1M4YMV0_9BURK|nr:PDR/VanB family oxidoreductase [Lampropedia hyalina]SHF07145.1 vanillate O-demethylase ferredoxin subunit [Lampropedia hyalina DSM 16112]